MGACRSFCIAQVRSAIETGTGDSEVLATEEGPRLEKRWPLVDPVDKGLSLVPGSANLTPIGQRTNRDSTVTVYEYTNGWLYWILRHDSWGNLRPFSFMIPISSKDNVRSLATPGAL